MRHPAILLFVLGASLAPAAPAPPPTSWRGLLLPRQEIADADNALVRWRPEFPAFFPEDRAILDELVGQSSPLVDFTKDNSSLLKPWLELRAKHLPFLKLNPGESLQLPPLNGPETPFPDHQPLRQLTHIRIAALKAAWLAGRQDEAIDLALENLVLSRALLTTQEGIIPLLNASGLWQLSLDCIYWLARQPALSPAQATRLQLALLRDDRLAATALVRAFRGEFTFFTHVVVDRLPRTHDVELLLSSIGSLGMAPPTPLPEGEPGLAVATREPFDREATLQAAADDVRGWINAFTTSARHPRGLTETHTFPRLQSYAKELPGLLRYASQEAPPTPEQIASINAEIATVDNPVGKLFLIITTSQWEPLSVSVFRRDSERSALTGLLAWRRLGHPASWKDLIIAGLLPEPPADPFSNNPLRFSLDPVNPRIWSVGSNSLDDGGDGSGENLGQPLDLTWPAK